MRVEESIYIERPADEVFAFFDDRRNDGRWMATVHESEWIDLGEQTAIGRRGRMVMDAMGTREFTDVVTPFVARQVRRMYRQDLERLKAILESRDPADDPV